jgi:transcriptional antiterminator RfaH
VADRIIDELRQREVEGAVELPTRELRCGDAVRITRGPFRELEGLFAGQAPHERVAILLSLLGGQQRVTLARDAVEAIG